jgi:signal transduction histidine kinase
MIEVLRRELQTHPQFAESIEDLDTMRRSILDTVGTMDRLLNAERLRRGKMPIKLAEVDLKSLLEDIAKVLHFQAADRSVTVAINASNDLKINSDRELLSQVLQNLTANAIKYGGSGKTVTLSAKKNGKAGEVQISVKDEGPGIDPDKLQSLFAPFTRGETYGQSGTGLGLFIARQAAHLLGAQIWAESEVGQGTVFHLDLKNG